MRPVVSCFSEQEGVKVSQWHEMVRARAIRQNWEEDSGSFQLCYALSLAIRIYPPN